jgi:hypothetical protein
MTNQDFKNLETNNKSNDFGCLYDFWRFMGISIGLMLISVFIGGCVSNLLPMTLSFGEG